MCIVHHLRVMNVESLSISLMGPPRLWMMQPAPAKGCNTTNNETPNHAASLHSCIIFPSARILVPVQTTAAARERGAESGQTMARISAANTVAIAEKSVAEIEKRPAGVESRDLYSPTIKAFSSERIEFNYFLSLPLQTDDFLKHAV